MQIYGLDSNSGLTANNRRALGRIDPKELAELERMLTISSAAAPLSDVMVVRAIVVHHSLVYSSTFSGFKMLERHSRDELKRIAATYGCAAVLTGHTHDFYYDPPLTMNVQGRSCELRELRCATTLQGPPKDGKQGFLLHCLERRDAKCTWRMWRYRWYSGRFIRVAKSPCMQFSAHP